MYIKALATDYVLLVKMRFNLLFDICVNVIVVSAKFLQNDYEYSDCLMKVINKSFAETDTLILLTKRTTIRNFRAKNPILIYDFDEFHLDFLHIRTYIIFLNEYADLVTTFREGFFDKDGKFIIHLPELTHLKDLHRYLTQYYVYNTYIIANNTDVYNIHSVYGIKEIGACSSNLTLKFESFPQTFTNNTLTAALFDKHLPLPYIGDPSSKFPGILIKPLQLLNEKYGIQLNYEVASIEREESFIRRGIVDVVDDLNDGTLDIIVFEPYRYDVSYKLVTVSDIVFYNPHIWLVPKPNKMPNFKVLISIFNLITWLTIFVIFILMVSIWYIYAKYRNDKFYDSYVKCFLDIYVLNLSMSITRIPHSIKLKLLIIIYILYAFHLSAFFQGKLSSVLTLPIYDSRISTLEQLADSNLKILVVYHKLSTIKNINTNVALKMASKSEPLEEKYISINRPEYVMKRRDIALSSLVGDLNLTDTYKTKVDVIKDVFLPDLEGTYQMKRHNPIMLTLNNVIRVIREGGLHTKWLNDMKIVNFLTYTKDDDADGQIILTFEHLEGPFILLAFGICSSTIIFGVELCGTTMKRLLLMAYVRILKLKCCKN